jgi:hypothetical protein
MFSCALNSFFSKQGPVIGTRKRPSDDGDECGGGLHQEDIRRAASRGLISELPWPKHHQ